jgi:hypothetical protein
LTINLNYNKINLRQLNWGSKVEFLRKGVTVKAGLPKLYLSAHTGGIYGAGRFKIKAAALHSVSRAMVCATALFILIYLY